MTRRGGWWLAVLLLTVWGSPAPAAPLRVVVRVTNDVDAAFLERARGQTADLDVELIAAPQPPVEETLPLQWAAAARLAALHGAPVVVWCTPGAEGAASDELLVQVAQPSAGRLLARSAGRTATGSGEAAGPTSATLEEAALVLRTALRVLAAGGTIGVEAPAVVAPPTPPPPPTPPLPIPRPPPPVPAPPVPPVVAPEERVGWKAELSWCGVFDAAVPAGLHGIAARLGLLLEMLEISVTGSVGLPSELAVDLATVRLSRHDLSVALGVRFDLAAGLAATVGARVGAAFFQRTTGGAADWLTAKPARTSLSFLLGAEAGLEWAPPELRGVGFVLSFGADWEPQAPSLVYGSGGRSYTLWDLWPVQPRVGLGLLFRSP